MTRSALRLVVAMTRATIRTARRKALLSQRARPTARPTARRTARRTVGGERLDVIIGLSLLSSSLYTTLHLCSYLTFLLRITTAHRLARSNREAVPHLCEAANRRNQSTNLFTMAGRAGTALSRLFAGIHKMNSTRCACLAR